MGYVVYRIVVLRIWICVYVVCDDVLVVYVIHSFIHYSLLNSFM